MKICSQHHDEIVYDGRDCPLCEANQTVADRDKEIEDLCDEIESLKDRPNDE